MIKKILSIILALSMILTIMPISAMAADIVEYNVWVGGVPVDSVNKDNITGDGIEGTVSYDPTTNTLTLDNATITSAYNTSGYNDTVSIYSNQYESMTINLIGKNIITGVDAIQSSYGIRCNGKLTIEGEGSLTVTSGKGHKKGPNGNNDSSGILAGRGLIINNTTLDVTGDKNGCYGYGIITVNGGNLTAYGSNSAIMGNSLSTNGKKISFKVGNEKPGVEWDGSTNLYTCKYIKVEFAPIYTIGGVIKGSDTNKGIEATLQLKNPDNGDEIGDAVTANIDGTYIIPNVLNGTYIIEVSSEGYESSTINNFVVSNTNVTGKNLTLTKNVTFVPVEDISITNATSVQANTDLTLSGNVYPDTATNQEITWSVEDANGTGATVINGSTFKATSVGIAKVKASVASGLTENHDYTEIFDITVTAAPVVTHVITATAITGGSISPSGSVTVTNGASQTFTITPNSNYSIGDVNVDGVSQGAISTYTFRNVTGEHTISATFNYNGGSGSGSSSGGRTSSNNSSIIITRPTADQPDRPTQGEIKVPGTVDSRGNATVNITEKDVTDVIDKALADAKQNGNEQNGITVVLLVDTGSKTGSNVTVNLPKTVQDIIIAKKIVNTIVVVDNPDIRISMDLATVHEINKQAKSDVNIIATRTDSGKLTGDAKKAICNRPVFELNVNYGSDKQVHDFGIGSVLVTIPYTIGANEKSENVCAVYVDSNGAVHWLTSSVYDSVNNVLSFSTNHFSTYGVGYKEDAPEFTDIASHWAKEDIEFVVSRGLFGGTSDTTFSPNTAMTRGMFVTVLGRLANADVISYNESSFNDVKSDAYYMGYIEWASKNNIVNGTGNGNFAPDQAITREQMAVIISNYAKTMDLKLTQAHGENAFADSAEISAYAKDAVKQMRMAGVISGKNGNLFDPHGTVIRAEVSAVLHRFVEGIF